MEQKRILAINDLSCVGQCSLSVALPIISACGTEVCVLPTAVFSNHTGEVFGGFKFHALTRCLDGFADEWKKNNVKFDAIYVGYLLDVNQIEQVKKIIREFLKEGGKVFIDPTFADGGERYPDKSDAFVSAILDLSKGADFIFPNVTEAKILADCNELDEAADRLLKIAKNVVITGVDFEKEIGVKALGRDFENGVTLKTDKVAGNFYGTGDVFASAFIGAYLMGKDAKTCIEIAQKFVKSSIEATPASHPYGINFEGKLGFLIDLLNDR